MKNEKKHWVSQSQMSKTKTATKAVIAKVEVAKEKQQIVKLLKSQIMRK